MYNADAYFAAVRGFAGTILLNLFLRVTGYRIKSRTLGEGVIVSGLHRPTFEVIALRIAHVAVVRGEFRRAAQHRIVHADAGAPTVNEAVTLRRFRCTGSSKNAVFSNTGTSGRIDELVFKVLAEGDHFETAVKGVVAAQGVGVAVVKVFTFVFITGERFFVTPVCRIDNEHGFKAVVEISQSNGRVAIRRRFTFRAALCGAGNAVVLEGVHGVSGKARKRRSLVGNRVVNARPHGSGGVRGGEARRVVRKQRFNRTEEAVRAQDAAEDRHAAEGEGTEAARESHLRLTTEETASLLGVKITGVGFNPGFEHKTEFQAVAEIFRTAKAPVGTEFLTVFHREFVGFRALVGIRMRIRKARVDEAVHFNVRSHGGR